MYEALHLGLGARVAVKVLRPGIPETADIRRKRFMREAQVAARIQSDHVVRVFDIVAPEEGRTYIVMELLRGETLAERAKRVGRLPIEDAVDYVLQAAKPLAEMHEAGIVHRDVKPSNLFITRDKEGGERIKLIDFGVAAFRQPLARGESSLTLAEAVIGTPRYMGLIGAVSSGAPPLRPRTPRAQARGRSLRSLRRYFGLSVWPGFGFPPLRGCRPCGGTTAGSGCSQRLLGGAGRVCSGLGSRRFAAVAPAGGRQRGQSARSVCWGAQGESASSQPSRPRLRSS